MATSPLLKLLPVAPRFTGVPPSWFFILQGAGHLVSALTSNKFFWWYGKKAESRTSRMLVVAAGCCWIVAAFLFAR